MKIELFIKKLKEIQKEHPNLDVKVGIPFANYKEYYQDISHISFQNSGYKATRGSNVEKLPPFVEILSAIS